MAEQVTKTKNPGRVAQGHKLAALNKERKEKLRQAEQPAELSTELSKEQSQEQTAVLSSAWYCGGAAIILGVVIAFFFYQRKKPALAPVSTRVDDNFCMN